MAKVRKVVTIANLIISAEENQMLMAGFFNAIQNSFDSRADSLSYQCFGTGKY
tara:strand:- start:211 stop:369 length:159 start_codon:yes stop_codon:yes gene_type:complete